MPFSSVTSTWASPVVREVMRNGTLDRCSIVPLFALVNDRSPRIACSLKARGAQELMCSSVPSGVREATQGTVFRRYPMGGWSSSTTMVPRGSTTAPLASRKNSSPSTKWFSSKATLPASSVLNVQLRLGLACSRLFAPSSPKIPGDACSAISPWS